MSSLSEGKATIKRAQLAALEFVTPRVTINASSSTLQNSQSSQSSTLSSKKKKQKLVFSQPTDTGVVKHTLSQLHNVIRFLKANNHFSCKNYFLFAVLMYYI